MGSIKDKVTSVETFVRLPVGRVGGAEGDPLGHVRPDAARPRRRGADRRHGQADRAQAHGTVTLPDGGAGLTVDDATKQRAVDRFLR